jgi:hypothetical protein
MYLYLARYSCTVLLNLEIESTGSADTDIDSAKQRTASDSNAKFRIRMLPRMDKVPLNAATCPELVVIHTYRVI